MQPNHSYTREKVGQVNRNRDAKMTTCGVASSFRVNSDKLYLPLFDPASYRF